MLSVVFLEITGSTAELAFCRRPAVIVGILFRSLDAGSPVATSRAFERLALTGGSGSGLVTLDGSDWIRGGGVDLSKGYPSIRCTRSKGGWGTERAGRRC